MDVSASLARDGTARSDQGAVWQEVGEVLFHSGAQSPSAAMHEAHMRRMDTLEEYLEALSCPDGAMGVIVVINGRFVALDLFSRPMTMRQLWGRLIRSYALDTYLHGRDRIRPLSRVQVDRLLEGLMEATCTPQPTAGLGQDWRLESRELVGLALVAEGECVHLSAFPRPRHRDEPAPEPQIAPPSRRNIG